MEHKMRGGRWGRGAMRRRAWSSRRPVLLAGVLLGLGVGLATADEQLKQSGTVSIEEVQLAWFGSANLGGGKLQFGGQTRNFTVGGLGIGGFGISKITATGEVYNLTDIAYFPGAYAQGRYGIVVGNASAGELWLKNPNGVVLHMKAQREGLALSLGGDAVYISLD